MPIVPKGGCALALIAGLALAGCAGGPSPSHGRGHHHGPNGTPKGGGGPEWHAISADVFLFLEYDGDHDQRITRAELKTATDAIWREVSQGKAALGLIDLRAGLAKLYGTIDFDFDSVSLDPDGDRSVTADDFARWLTHRFNALDANGDGVIARDEFYRRAAGGRREGPPRESDGGY